MVCFTILQSQTSRVGEDSDQRSAFPLAPRSSGTLIWLSLQLKHQSILNLMLYTPFPTPSDEFPHALGFSLCMKQSAGMGQLRPMAVCCYLLVEFWQKMGERVRQGCFRVWGGVLNGWIHNVCVCVLHMCRRHEAV